MASNEQVFEVIKVITIQPTLTVHATYVSGDYVGTSLVPMRVPGVTRRIGGKARIVSASLTDKAAAAVACELWLFDKPVVTPADSAAWTITDDDMCHCLGVIPFSTYYASAANAIAIANNVQMLIQAAQYANDIWAALITRGSPGYADGDVQIRLGVVQGY